MCLIVTPQVNSIIYSIFVGEKRAATYIPMDPKLGFAVFGELAISTTDSEVYVKSSKGETVPAKLFEDSQINNLVWFKTSELQTSGVVFEEITTNLDEYGTYILKDEFQDTTNNSVSELLQPDIANEELNARFTDKRTIGSVVYRLNYDDPIGIVSHNLSLITGAKINEDYKYMKQQAKQSLYL